MEPAANAPSAAPSAGNIPAAFKQDPVAYLNAIAAKPASPQSLEQLAGPVAKFLQNDSSSTPAAAAAYLQAASVQLKDTASLAGNAQLEAIAAVKQYEVVTAAGVCATLCQDRRHVISSSGILPTLANLMLNSETQSASQLSIISVEFLQCALIAEQYRYAARLVAGTWPRPDATANVKMVLRYYYIRGMIHLGCNDYVMAHRCFWTCLSIPADIASKVAVEAWKKLVLTQCIMSDCRKLDSCRTVLPKSMPTCMGRILTSSKEESAFSTAPAKGSGTKRPQPSGGIMFPPPESAAPKPRPSKKSQAETESCGCYMEIVAAFYGGDKAKFMKLISDNTNTLKADGNWGLTEQCLTQLHNNRVRHISKMYSVVSMSKAAEILELRGDNAQQEVATLLIQSGVPCEIQEDGMIEFHEPIEDHASNLDDIADWIALLERVQRLDVNILTSARYQSLMKQDSMGTSTDAKIAAAGPRSVGDL
mmetsp:Transcript_65713/g.189458  ORF Transcript_65713/g.189458 Transcript_65713/m.189458 type:complete len:478 (+) Transcript_65713:214-1647(+)|eukprot:CAMPEP_0176020976 /NCGR_PEP_ID=MMETSP0120_2-20121206/10176_1 /TAXON_ID=160619 /ORGANISM="Kryptoperidinium foliaceum, Strain CCMP 1326" /LENGTH=477 /DNA_ID=CAMNT_0017354085 /DNA_START=155 /DNA_END=1588 /DNA_ORIENTATION=-